MDLAPVRKFLLASYYDLPNVLFIGALVLGSLTGYLALVWVAMGMILNFGATYAGHFILVGLAWIFNSIAAPARKVSALQKIFPAADVAWPISAKPMDRFGSPAAPVAANGDAGAGLIPSLWISSASFFAIFSLINSGNVLSTPAAPSKEEADNLSADDKDKVSARQAFSASTIFVGLLFMLLIFLRRFTGYETWTSTISGMLIGGGMAAGYWSLLYTYGAARIPDVLQVLGSMAPNRSGSETPVMCVPPPREEEQDE
jgi:hypothetical protein